MSERETQRRNEMRRCSLGTSVAKHDKTMKRLLKEHHARKAATNQHKEGETNV